MAVNRKIFLKTLGGVSLGILAGPLAASSGRVFGASTNSVFTLTRNEEKHLAHFYDQLRSSSFPPSENAIDGFRPARLLKRKSGIRGYHLEYIAQNGSKIVMTSKKGQLLTKSFQSA